MSLTIGANGQRHLFIVTLNQAYSVVVWFVSFYYKYVLYENKCQYYSIYRLCMKILGNISPVKISVHK